MSGLPKWSDISKGDRAVIMDCLDESGVPTKDALNRALSFLKSSAPAEYEEIRKELRNMLRARFAVYRNRVSEMYASYETETDSSGKRGERPGSPDRGWWVIWKAPSDSKPFRLRYLDRDVIDLSKPFLSMEEAAKARDSRAKMYHSKVSDYAVVFSEDGSGLPPFYS